jgi:putative transcriptional regulator
MIKLLLNEMLLERGKSVYWLSKKTETRYATMHAWAKQNPREIRLDILERICIALECEPGDLLVMTKRKRKVTSR